MLEEGIKGSGSLKVTKELTAVEMKSGTLPVFATPAMAALMEETAYKSVADYLLSGECTVGSGLNISHISPSCLGADIECESILTKVEGKKLIFHVTARDKAGIIGEGEHIRYIVNGDRFLKKAENK